MKKKLSVLLSGITMAFAGTLVSCEVEQQGLYSLDKSNFDSLIAYQSEITYDDLYVIKQMPDGTQTRISVTADMFTTPIDTSSVGTKQAQITYAGESYTLDYTVKYKVEFAVDSEVIDEQFVLSVEEIEFPQVEEKEGYDFVSWNDVLPETLTENLYFAAIFEEEVNVPALTEVKAEYGDLLLEIALPSNADGAWQFVGEENQTVGAVGSREVEAQFILNDGENTVHSTALITLTVEKKNLEFINTVTEFEYDGQAHTPLYSFNGVEIANVNVTYIPYYSGDAVSAGNYDFELVIEDENYKGSFEGSFEITKKYAKLSVVGNYEINLGEALPNVQYTVVDKDGEALSQDLLSLMNVEVVEPTIIGAGKYELTLLVNNANFNVVVEKGELIVNKGVLAITPQITANTKIVYGDALAGITFVEVPQGVWSWKNANTVISTPTSFTATAVFTPNDTDNYEIFEAEVTLSVEKREVAISVTQNTFVYNGEAQSLKYSVEGVLAGDENAFNVVGNTEQINAGTYENILLQIESDKYQGKSAATSLIIEQASIADFAFAQSQISEVVWNANARLQDVTLPSGYAWKDGLTALSIGNNTYEVEFTPEDARNYKTESGQISVSVLKAAASITVANTTFTYNKDNSYDLSISANHKESALTCEYALKDGTPVERLSDAGEYTVTITLPESEHYNATSAIISVTINAVENTDEISVYSATYLDTLGGFDLPENEYGKWTWDEGDGAKVGAFGEQTHKATFTPYDSKNYQSRSVDVKFNVAKFAVNVPVVTAKTYTGETFKANIEASDFYEITKNNGGVNVGSYDVVVTLLDENYKWADGEETLARTLVFEITKATNAWTKQPSMQGWTYGDAQVNASAEAKFGEVKITYFKNGEAFDELPEKLSAGKYSVNFSVAETENYNGLTQEIEFTVAKKAVNVPQIQSKSYTGETLTADVAESDLYEVVKNDGGVDCGKYEVILKLKDATNYSWKSPMQDAPDCTVLTFEIAKNANNTWTIEPALDKTSWIYGETAAVVSAEATVGEVKITFVDENGVETAQMPTDAGSYTAKFVVESTDEYNGLTKEIGFTISKKTITAPTIESISYDGKSHTASVEESEYYTVDLSKATDVVNVGKYEVSVTLNNANYKWSDGSAAPQKTLVFTIEKATNAWIQAPALDKTSWIYGENAAAITASAKFGEVKITYQNANGEEVETMLTAAGTYKVQFSLAGTDNYNGLATVVLEYTINRRVVSVPTLSASSIYYDGAEHTPIAESDYYVIGGDTNAVEIGSYTLTVSLVNENYVWNDETTDAKTYSFEIVKAPATISNFELSKTEWYYGEDAATLSAESDGEGVIKYYFDTSANGAFTSTTMPTNAGVYYVKAVLEDGEEIVKTEPISFVIKKAMVSLGAPVYSADTVYYENTVEAATAYVTEAKATDNFGNAVKGTFKYSIELGQAITDGCINVTVTFTLEDAANYGLATSSVTAKIKVKTVAYIDSTNYGSVESALKNAVSGNAVWVTAGLTDAVIAQSCTIPSGVTLNIPHTAGAMNSDGKATLSGDNKTYGSLTQMALKTNITLNAGVILTNKGTLKIAGELSGGNGGSAYAGHTAGAYAKLTLDTNAQIVNTGTIHCFGIIAEKTVNNGSKISVESGTLYVPFVVRDFRGGSYMYGVYNKRSSLRICPFNQFEFRNVTSLLQISYGAKVYGYANLYAGSQHNATTVELVGTASSSLIQLTIGAYMTYKYTPRVYSSATAYTETVGDTVAEGVATLHFYGGATVNSMKLDLEIVIEKWGFSVPLPVSIDTANYYFPLTWRFNVTLHNGTYKMNNRYKMMAGAKLTVESDASLTVTELTVYNDEDWTDTCKTGGNLYVNRGDAILTVKGTLNATTLAGDVYIQGGTVTATNTSITTYEAIEVSSLSLKSYATIANTYNAITV